MASSRSGTLPEHAKDGRTSFSGPLQGGYVTFTVCVDNIANSESPEFEIVAPFDMRIMKITTALEAVTSDPVLIVQNAGTDLVASINLTVAAIDHTLVAAQRNVAKDALLNVAIVADSGDAATGVCVAITAYARGHVFTDETND